MSREDDYLNNVATRYGISSEERIAAIRGLNNDSYLKNIATGHYEVKVKVEAAARLSNARDLNDIATGSESKEVRLVAIKRLAEINQEI